MSAGFSYNDTELKSCTTTAIAVVLCDRGVLVPAGSPLALSPKFQGNMRLRYEWETGSGLKPFVQLGFHHVGKTVTSAIDNTSILYTGCRAPYTCSVLPSTINGVTVNIDDVLQAQKQSFAQPSYNTFEGSIGLSKDQWSATLYIDNIGDERPQLFTSANDGDVRVTTSRPRTIGLRVSYSM